MPYYGAETLGLHAVAIAAETHGQTLGGMPTSSVTRVLEVPSDEQPTAKQASLTLGSCDAAARPCDAPRHQVAVGRLAVGELRLMPPVLAHVVTNLAVTFVALAFLVFGSDPAPPRLRATQEQSALQCKLLVWAAATP